ncbi:MAG TPA: hypothetical protein VFR24_06970 [Candidatus Angelobacter sp.]|jgi:hypothetical protein|nr:hypothetical protein [Candidatus Angelobacter sp.]
MYLKIMIAISLAALCLALFLPVNEQYEFLVYASAALIVLHALRAKPDYLWAGTFGSIAVPFNPIIPVPLASRASVAEQSGPPTM